MLEQPGHDTPQINLNVRGLRPSATVAINERCNTLRQQGREIYKLGLGQSPFPVPEPVVEALRRHAHEKDYLPVTGLAALRQAVAEHQQRTFGIDCKAEQVLVGPGSKELMFLLQLVYYGDILIPTPAWVSYEPQARIIGRHIHRIVTSREHGWLLTPAQLDAFCRNDPQCPRLLILNYPSNPTGQTYNAEQLAELADVARRYGVVVLSDEIYGKLHHRGEHQSIVPLYSERTIFSGGLSKWCGAGGWRLGFFVIPEGMDGLRQAMATAASETFTSTAAPIQHAAVTAFRPSAEIDTYLESCRRVLAGLGPELARRLRAASMDVLDPQGAFYLWVDFEARRSQLERAGIADARSLSARLLDDTGVAILPGVDFGRTPTELTARLAYVDFDGSQAQQAALSVVDDAVDLDFLGRYCERQLTAIDRIVDWFSAFGG